MRSGLSLIEIMLGIAIMVILTGAGVTISMRSTQRKSVEAASDKLASWLGEIKSNAQSGKSDPICGQGTLLGWRIEVGASDIRTEGHCYQAASPGYIMFGQQTYVYPSGVTNSPTLSFMFLPLGQGTDLAADTSIDVIGTGLTKTITVSKSGTITGP